MNLGMYITFPENDAVFEYLLYGKLGSFSDILNTCTYFIIIPLWFGLLVIQLQISGLSLCLCGCVMDSFQDRLSQVLPECIQFFGTSIPRPYHVGDRFKHAVKIPVLNLDVLRPFYKHRNDFVVAVQHFLLCLLILVPGPATRYVVPWYNEERLMTAFYSTHYVVSNRCKRNKFLDHSAHRLRIACFHVH